AAGASEQEVLDGIRTAARAAPHVVDGGVDAAMADRLCTPDTALAVAHAEEEHLAPIRADPRVGDAGACVGRREDESTARRDDDCEVAARREPEEERAADRRPQAAQLEPSLPRPGLQERPRGGEQPGERPVADDADAAEADHEHALAAIGGGERE